MELKCSPLDIYLWTGAIDERDGCLWNKASVFRVSPDHPPSPPPLPGDRLQVRLLIPTTTTTTTTTSLRHLSSLTLSISIRQKKRRARHRLLWGEEKIAEQHALCFLFFLFFFFSPRALPLPSIKSERLPQPSKKKKKGKGKQAGQFHFTAPSVIAERRRDRERKEKRRKAPHAKGKIKHEKVMIYELSGLLLVSVWTSGAVFVDVLLLLWLFVNAQASCQLGHTAVNYGVMTQSTTHQDVLYTAHQTCE